jgi:hypothetical protein
MSITPDYWSVVLPGELATSSPRSPSLFAYHAALNLLDARVLFSAQKVAELLDPATNAHRNALERHHLFPKEHLRTLKITDTRDTNQIATYALVEWGDNAEISEENGGNQNGYRGRRSSRVFVGRSVIALRAALPRDHFRCESHGFAKQ